MALDADTFSAKVDTSGDHHLWLGSKSARGTGQIRIDGTLFTAVKVSWELAHGPVPDGYRVKSCPNEPSRGLHSYTKKGLDRSTDLVTVRARR